MSDTVVDRVPFTLRSVGAADGPAVLELLRMTLGEKATTRKTADYWDWKHVRNPFGASYAVCAEDPATRALAGLRALMRWRYLDDTGAHHPAVRAVDTATHPQYQRKGIFSSLTRYAIEDLRRSGTAFVFNTPNTNSLPGYLKMGWRVVATWPVYVRPVRPLRSALRALLRRSPAGSADLAACGLVEWNAFRAAHAAEIDEVVRRHEQMRPRVGYRTDRGGAYLDWRYGMHPDVRYGVYALRDRAGALEAFLVARPTAGTRGLTALVAVEVFAREPSPTAIARLLRSAFRHVDGNYWIAHFAEGTHERTALRRTGFVRAPRRGYTWTALSLQPLRLDPASAASWDLTLGELEIF